MRFLTAFTLTILLLFSACSSTPSEQEFASQKPANFSVDPKHPKIFFYAAYLDPSAIPTFEDKFTLRIDKNTIEDIEPNQYIEVEFPAGDHTIDVDQVAWSGFTLSHSTVTIYVDPRKPTFVAEELLPNDKAVLTPIDTARGQAAIRERSRRCLCPNGLKDLIQYFTF